MWLMSAVTVTAVMMFAQSAAVTARFTQVIEESVPL